MNGENPCGRCGRTVYGRRHCASCAELLYAEWRESRDGPRPTPASRTPTYRQPWQRRGVVRDDAPQFGVRLNLPMISRVRSQQEFSNG